MSFGLCILCKDAQGVVRYVGGDYDTAPRREVSCDECYKARNVRNWKIVFSVLSIVLTICALGLYYEI